MIREVEELFQRQLIAWPQLAKGIEGLARAQTRATRIDWYEVLVRHIPHRIVSTTAPVDPESVATRPCFLCVGNLPPEQEGVQFGGGFNIYCNPFPIVERHLTIAHSDHTPQRIAHQFGTMLELAATLPGYFVIYNGPECGASAPDHMHFQAGFRTPLPIAQDTAGLIGPAVPNYARRVLLFRGGDRAVLTDRVDRAIALLAEATGYREEPLINLAVFYEGNEWTTYLFPRGKHRPDVFHTGELTVSPAAIDLCGIFVVPRERDFQSITGEAIAAIFREVTLPRDQFTEVVAKLERTI